MAVDAVKGADLPPQLFPERNPLNVDGTPPETYPDGKVVYWSRACDRCGTLFDDRWKLHRVGRKVLCRLCLDKG